MIYQDTITFLFEETEQFQGIVFHIISIHLDFFFLSCMSWVKKKLVFISLNHFFSGVKAEV